MTIGDRFLLFLRERKLTQKDFCKKTGYNVQSLSKFVSGAIANPGVNLFILTSEHFPELNMQWLMTGKAPMWFDDKIPSTEISSDELIYLGKGKRKTSTDVYDELLETKDELIEMLREKIKSLEEENTRLKK